MGRVLLLFTVLCCVLYSETAVDIQNKKAIVRRLEQCRGKRNLPILFKDTVVGRDENTEEIKFSTTVDIKQEVKTLAIIVNFWKCDASGNPDSCEYVVRDYNISTVCEIIKAKNEFWSAFIDHFEPPLVCPIKAGTYRVKELPVTTDILKYFPVSDAVWKAQLTGYEHDKLLSCVEFEEQIVASYKKRH